GKLAALGIPGRRAESLKTLAEMVASGQLSLEPGPNPEETVTCLLRLAGVGNWTAHYIAMRAGGLADAVPHGDLGLRKALGEKSSRSVRKLAEAWRPWRAYAAMHLWNSLNLIR